jgi:hypothetical protein
MPPLSAVERRETPAVDRARALAEDVERERLGLPLRFAVPIEVVDTPESTATWHVASNGTHVWHLHVSAPGAYNLNFGFTRYRMPPGGALYIYTPDGTEVLGPYTERDKANSRASSCPIPAIAPVIHATLPSKDRSMLCSWPLSDPS